MRGICIAARSAAGIVHGVWHPPLEPVRADGVLRVQGYRRPELVKPKVRKAVEAATEKANALLELEVRFARAAVAGVDRGRIALPNGARLECPAFDQYFDGIVAVVAYVLSTGAAIDFSVQECVAREELLDAVILESAAWLAIEAGTRRFASLLGALAAHDGLKPTMRMGPGYSYKVGGERVTFALDQQRALFSLFDGVHLPVELLDSSVMRPKLSRSGLFGLAPVGSTPHRISSS